MPQSGNVTQNIPEDWEDQGATIPEGERKWDPQERPPADWFNYFFYHVIEALKDLDINAEELANGITAASILSKLKNVDGAGSGLDADTVDGKHASVFLEKTGGTMTGTLINGYGSIISRAKDVSSNVHYWLQDKDGVNRGVLYWGRLSDRIIVRRYASDGTTPEGELEILASDIRFNDNSIYHQGNDGSGSGLDADLLDGYESTAFFRSLNNVITAKWENSVLKFYVDGTGPHLIEKADYARNGCQTGDIIFRASNGVPYGFLECNGASISRTAYANLFAAIGTTFGSGDGSTTFNIPDLRGEFVRGWDNVRGVDSERSFGSWQEDEFKSHNHRFINEYDTPTNRIIAYTDENGEGIEGSTIPSDINRAWTYIFMEDTGGSETRPRNIALLPCIKY